MSYYPEPLPVPDGLDTARLSLRVLRPKHNALDYDAVMASREQLLRRSNGRWPRPGFTPEENLADLVEHEREHAERVAFTYTVLSPARDRCLGCLYLAPLTRTLDRLEVPPEARPPAAGRRSDATFWLRPDAWELEEHLLAELGSWFERDWAFASLYFVANAGEPRNLQLFEGAGLQRSYGVTDPAGRDWFFFEKRRSGRGISAL